jgi:hypothetical protein
MRKRKSQVSDLIKIYRRYGMKGLNGAASAHQALVIMGYFIAHIKLPIMLSLLFQEAIEFKTGQSFRATFGRPLLVYFGLQMLTWTGYRIGDIYYRKVELKSRELSYEQTA